MTSLTESYVTQLLVQTSFYGLYMTTFGMGLRWLLFTDEGWKLRKPFDWPMLVATILIFTFYTTWLGVHARLTMESVRGVEFNLYHTYVLGAVTVRILSCDLTIIYRCWKVYNKSWRITILPVLCWLGCLICIILVFYYNDHLIMTLDDTWALKSTHVHVAFYPFNAATNIYTTAAIIYRVNRDASKGSGHSFKRLRRLCRNLAETGSLYTLTTIPPLVGFFLDADKYLVVLFVAEAVNLSMAGIAFNLVLIRVGQSRANAGGSQLDSQTTDRRRLLSGRHHHHPSPSTQEKTITTLGDAEKGVLSITSAPGADQVARY
ncbi:hypothetical protein M378DRAFT_130795 [Amanita muscaria Koide BX008]|uniref:Uncharacterized protein n=1 Tax=Amanita muscaria (strain Koide BX008) TaxID=946122 RepID=A0A0C2T177_AMAMK|nr:hypothetical protein M378DRAFT_130795 [Amanita muscaria Koide BX008]